ncbi:MAG: DUF302 domain-containing protein [Methylovulum sp.]|nr:DUF302 domain-containing protein [Methylovulum sp.]
MELVLKWGCKNNCRMRVNLDGVKIYLAALCCVLSEGSKVGWPNKMLERFIVFTSVLFLASCAVISQSESVQYYQMETKKPYDEVLVELEGAIADNNFRITGHSRVGKVIRDRGDKDFPDYDTIQFCNLTYAKFLLQMAPEAIRHMPCTVFMYKTKDRTIVTTRLLPTDTNNKELNELSFTINEMLKQIVDFAVEE